MSDTHGVVAASASKGNGASLVEKIKNLKAESSLALMELKSAQGNLAQINIQKLPAENQWQFEKLKKELPNLITNLDKSQGLMQFLVGFLGEKDLRRYLFIFQNDNELRATGGFMGSFSLVDLKNGNVAGVNLPAGGTYDTRAGLKEMLQAPKPMQIVGYRWEFQDANWWPDWPTSASKVAWFFEKSGGPTVDGVIAINSDWLGKLLQTTGPIDLPDYKKTITAANFETELQTSIEVDATVKNRPKQILADLAPKLIERILSIKPEKFLALAQSLNEGLAQKDILIYLRDENLQKFASANNWDGRQQDYNFDYLSVVATNIAGGKTDNVIKQKIYHQATIQKDNSVIVNLLIDRSNFGPIDDVFTKTPNRSYLRVYAPLGAKLVKALGFVQPSAKAFKPVDPALKIDESLITENEAVVDYASQTKIYNENGRTVFGNWVTLNPGESRDLLLVYELPAKLKTEVAPAEGWTGKIKAAFFENRPATYGLLVQKQPGENDDEFFSNVIYPDGFEPQTGAGLNIDAQNQEVNFKGILVEDLEYEVKFLIP